MPKAKSPSVEALKIAASVGVAITSLPHPVDDNDVTPKLWNDCVGYLVGQPDQASADDLSDLTSALKAAKKAGKALLAADRADLKAIKQALKNELIQAKADRQAKKKQ